MRKGILLGLLAALVLAAPASASSHKCGIWRTLADGTRVTIEVLDGATCSFGRATAARFYAVDGVPRHLTVRGKRMYLMGSRPSASRSYFIYAYATGSVILYQYPRITPPPSRPVVPYPGTGYPVICADGYLSNSGGIQGACSHHGGVS
jgi:hypothetical protein